MDINRFNKQGYSGVFPTFEWAKQELERRDRGIKDDRHVLSIYDKLEIQWEEEARRAIQQEDARANKEKIARDSLTEFGKKV